jgi:hypothetical protein
MSHISFLGIPVEGEITKASRKAAQKPLSELEPLIRAVIDDPTIHSFGWTQATPYFNDGDPCVFSVHEPWFLTVDDEAKLEFDEDGYCEDFEEDTYSVMYGGHPTLGERDYDWVNREKVYKSYAGPDEARYDRCLDLAKAFDSEAFDDVLLDSFGDHARITVKRDGITVESYEHD